MIYESIQKKAKHEKRMPVWTITCFVCGPSFFNGDSLCDFIALEHNN